MTFPFEFYEFVFIYLGMFGADLLRYVVGAGGIFLIVNVLLAYRLQGHKIRDELPSGGQIRREITASMRTVAIFAANGTLIITGAHLGVFTIYQDAAVLGSAYLWFSIALLIVLHDAWFYWSHRALHYPPLFRRLHRLHHRSYNPTPFTSYSFDTGEAVINAIYLPLVLLVLPVHPIALFIFVVHMMLRNAIGHSGYELFPAKRNGKPLFDWMTTVTHHDQHHAHAGYNLGLYFTWWDRLMGTEHPEYQSAFAKVGRPLGRISTVSFAIIVTATFGFWLNRAEAAELIETHAAADLTAIISNVSCNGNSGLQRNMRVWK